MSIVCCWWECLTSILKVLGLNPSWILDLFTLTLSAKKQTKNPQKTSLLIWRYFSHTIMSWWFLKSPKRNFKSAQYSEINFLKTAVHICCISLQPRDVSVSWSDWSDCMMWGSTDTVWGNGTCRVLTAGARRACLCFGSHLSQCPGGWESTQGH